MEENTNTKSELSFEGIKDLLVVNNASDELVNLFSFIDSRLIKETPVPIIDMDYFVFSILQEASTIFYCAVKDYVSNESFEMVNNAYSKVIESKALNIIKPGRVVKYSQDIVDLINNAVKEQKELGDKNLVSGHLLLAILGGEDTQTKKVLNNIGLSYSRMIKDLLEYKENKNDNIEDAEIVEDEDDYEDGEVVESRGGMKVIKFSNPKAAQNFIDSVVNHKGNGKVQQTSGIKNKKKEDNINSYCVNLNDLVQQGKITKLIGRDNEVNKLVRVLGRRKKNNAVIVGLEGVGKTAIAEGLAYKIVHKDVPSFLHNKEIISLNMTAIVAGTTLRGMLEDRVNDLFKEIKAAGDYILFIDDIGNVLGDKKNNDSDFTAMISRELENGDLQVIGTSSFSSYRSTFDKDQSLGRRFTKIIVEVPTKEESIMILNEAKKMYEDFHNVSYSDDVIKACVNLSATYITERNLPDSAIDVLDEVGAQFGTIVDDENLKSMRESIDWDNEQIEQLKKQDNYKMADEITSSMKKKILEYNKAKEASKKNRSEHPIEITVDNILSVVSSKTGIPVTQLSSNEKNKLKSINERLKSEIIGQDEQIDTICKAIKRNRVGLRTKGCLYSALMIARTGVGKTLTAKMLAKEMFGNEDAIVRFDMSEYPDKSAVNKLIGSNPGYIGYEEGGQLTEAVKNKKYCVLLLDEIEKADKEVYNIFLQVLDEGFLTDNTGMKVDFSNVIVLFTSNIGAKKAAALGAGIGFNRDPDRNSKNIMSKELKNEFPPEFLNRLDNVIYFNSLTKDDINKIISIELDNLKERVKKLGYDYEYTNKTIDMIYEKVSEETEYGARPVKRAIQELVEDKITDIILDSDDLKPGYVFNIE